MERIIKPCILKGAVDVPPSKSVLHRILFARALTRLQYCGGADGYPGGGAWDDLMPAAPCDDIAATHDVLMALLNGDKEADVRASGTTLRFILPVLGVLGREMTLWMDDGLAARPLKEYGAELERHGLRIERTVSVSEEESQLHGADKGLEGRKGLKISGLLKGGDYVLPGNISSQYISGLLYALPLCETDSTLTITGKTESQNYVQLTLTTIAESGIIIDGFNKINPELTDMRLSVKGKQTYECRLNSAEGDWSSAAFWLTAEKLMERRYVKSGADIPGTGEEGLIRVCGMSEDSAQGDKRIAAELDRMFDGGRDRLVIDLKDIPDLGPVLAVAAAGSGREVALTGAARLHYKESDRIRTSIMMINDLGGQAYETCSGGDGEAAVSGLSDTIVVKGADELKGGTVDAHGDHRIAMAAAVASVICKDSVHIIGSECVSKSYPDFFEELERLSIR